MENVKNVTVSDNQPKELIKPIRIEEVLKTEKVIESFCESRNICGVNNAIGGADDVLF